MDNLTASGQDNIADLPKAIAGEAEPIVSSSSMWFGFLYIILFKTLYVSAIALAGILNHAVNKLIPDALSNTGYLGYYWMYGNNFLKGYIASIIVAFPIFAIVFLALKKREMVEPRIRGFRIRTVLVYITLTVTFGIMLCNVISTVYKFLGGETTVRSLAHLAVTLLVAGSVFVYFILEVRNHKRAA